MMHLASDPHALTTESNTPTVTLAVLEQHTNLGDDFGRELHAHVLHLPPGCMTRVAIEENRAWSVILSAASGERRRPCARCESCQCTRLATFRTIARTAGTALHMYELGVLPRSSWRGEAADRAALTAATETLSGTACGARTLAALVVGVRWQTLVEIIDDELDPLERVLATTAPRAERDGWRALLAVRRLAQSRSDTGDATESTLVLRDPALFVTVAARSERARV
jgi:hypothetical protein